MAQAVAACAGLSSKAAGAPLERPATLLPAPPCRPHLAQNGFFLPPGSSVVEVVPYQLDSEWLWGRALALFNAQVGGGREAAPAGRVVRRGPAWCPPVCSGERAAASRPAPPLRPPRRAPQDPSSKLAWWQVVVCDPALSAPGPVEQQGLDDTLGDGSSNYPRNRSVRLTWAALEAALAQIVAARGSPRLYKRLYYGDGSAGQRYRLYMAARRTAHGSCDAALPTAAPAPRRALLLS